MSVRRRGKAHLKLLTTVFLLWGRQAACSTRHAALTYRALLSSRILVRRVLTSRVLIIGIFTYPALTLFTPLTY